MTLMQGLLCLDEPAAGLRHALAMAPEMWRRLIINRESRWKVARSKGLDIEMIIATKAFLLRCKRPPSKERCALVVMNDKSFTNADIAEMFGEDRQWAKDVRSNAYRLREAEPLNESFRPWFYNEDPPPRVILEMASFNKQVLEGLGVCPRSGIPKFKHLLSPEAAIPKYAYPRNLD